MVEMVEMGSRGSPPKCIIPQGVRGDTDGTDGRESAILAALAICINPAENRLVIQIGQKTENRRFTGM